VFQNHFLLPEFTVLQNVMIPARKLGAKKLKDIEQDAMEILETLDIGSDVDKIASKLSGGQQQRVAIARALINKPKIIMADEPTGNLDSINASIVLDIFQKLSVQGHTIIVVTHDRDFASKSHRIVSMKDGTITREKSDPVEA
jgi:lipoprotein-releasing system ATP-binding protein